MASTMRCSRWWVTRFSPFSTRLNYLLSNTCFARSQSTSTEAEIASEYSETPEYPPLTDCSYAGVQRAKRQEQYDYTRRLPTVEEKLLYTYYSDETGAKKVLKRMVKMCDFDKHYDMLRFKLFATRTSLKIGLPDVYSRMNVDALAEHIKPIVLNAIRDTFDGMAQRVESFDQTEERPADVLGEQDKLRGQMMTDHIFRAVTAVLSTQLPHLRDCQVDYHPRRDAFWLAGGFAPPTNVWKFRKNKKQDLRPNYPIDHPIDARFQHSGKPYMHLRNTQPLPQFVDRDDPLCTTYDVPDYKYQTISSGLSHQIRCPATVPGFWPGDPYGFGSLTVFTTELLRNRVDMFGEDCCQDMLHSCGAVGSFAWLVALAHYKGFTIHQELTYPLTTQTVLTNGKHWSFYAYQLNTMCLHSDFYNEQYQNICWTTNGMKLFDVVENGKVIGYNDEVVKLIIKFLANAPKEREGVNLTPYLKTVDHTDDEEWPEICEKFKDYSATKIGDELPYGSRLWETIYKVKFNTRLE